MNLAHQKRSPDKSFSCNEPERDRPGGSEDDIVSQAIPLSLRREAWHLQSNCPWFYVYLAKAQGGPSTARAFA